MVEGCRIATSTGGRCEVGGGGLLDDPCTLGTDCDIIFQCYQGTCRDMCQLGTYECGDPSDCIDVGNDTYGVCAPFY